MNAYPVVKAEEGKYFTVVTLFALILYFTQITQFFSFAYMVSYY